MTPWNPTVFNKNIPKECQDRIASFQQEGHKILCIAFPAEGGNRWSLITNRGFFNRGIPDECHDKMREFHKAGEKVVWVAFPPAGGNRWSVITDKGFFNRNIPDECHDKMQEFHKAGNRMISVSFPPAGGNRWSVITASTFFNRGIPDECHDKMREFHQKGEKVISVGFPFAGGTRYTIITRNGEFFNRNSPGGCHRVMRAMSNSGVGQLAMVGFHPSGAYVIVSDADPAGKPQPALTNNGKTFSIDDYAANLKAQLDSKTCKYGFMVRYKSAMRAWAAGPKRTADNPPEQRFSVFHWFNPASVTKTITAVALLHVIHKKGLTIEEKIYKWLPKAWNIPDSFKTISVKELLHHTSGIRSGVLTYDELKDMVEAGINLKDKKVPEYQNTNYALARIVVAYLNGHKSSNADQASATAQNFIKYCQANIFDPLGIPGVEWKPDADDPTEFYPNPPGDSAGTSYGDWSLRPGSAGVHLSLAELSLFVAKLADTDVLLPQAIRTQMDNEGLGLGKHGSGKGEYYSKGGYFPGRKNGGAELHSVIAKYTNGVQLALVYNGDSATAQFDMEKAYNDAWK
uniref:Beta-lactamase-related domain-containing protein n=1 Tax=Candidatus Nitrotoga fabula TaxID=2182327 RepID=A0A2X0QTJ1_9PROT|nr:protein of unknown function [Candidatus Nitrotoga fabula]